LNVPDKIDVKIAILAQASTRMKRRNETVPNKHDKEGREGLSNGGSHQPSAFSHRLSAHDASGQGRGAGSGPENLVQSELHAELFPMRVGPFADSMYDRSGLHAAGGHHYIEVLLSSYKCALPYF
jgi:hypothetical protein